MHRANQFRERQIVGVQCPVNSRVRGTQVVGVEGGIGKDAVVGAVVSLTPGPSPYGRGAGGEGMPPEVCSPLP
ncbi:hypothetical protein FHK02_2395 [Spirosoma sp. LMG 31448]|nr:hypothetical protein [Spirosoma utsteinense]